MAEIIVIDRDRIGRPTRISRFESEAELPRFVRERMPTREQQVSDPRQETKGAGTARHAGGPWYELPDGSKVRGKEAVRDAGYEVPE